VQSVYDESGRSHDAHDYCEKEYLQLGRDGNDYDYIQYNQHHMITI
jgi:hypothetical protein